MERGGGIERASVLPRPGRGMRGDTGVSAVASRNRRAAGSRSWPWSSAWGDGTLCAFSREILRSTRDLPHTRSLALSLSSDPFLSLLPFKFPLFSLLLAFVSIEDVLRQAACRQCACSTSITDVLPLSLSLSHTIPDATLFTLSVIKANISIQTLKGRFSAS